MASNLSRFNPFSDMTRFEPFRNFDEMFNNFRLASPWANIEAEPRIRIDVNENENAYIVKADMPGVKKEEIKVNVEGNQVTIQAEVKKESEEKQEGKVVRSERYYGQQSRSFMLEQDIDDSKAEARYQDGVLQLTLPKKPGTTRKQISIQ